MSVVQNGRDKAGPVDPGRIQHADDIRTGASFRGERKVHQEDALPDSCPDLEFEVLDAGALAAGPT
ncbi:MAG: hypothetical protein NT154_16055 [Verrucomicrobia bacterium]|nr:hypothetical protein [Verrucomicrobiota bacterium]